MLAALLVIAVTPADLQGGLPATAPPLAWVRRGTPSERGAEAVLGLSDKKFIRDVRRALGGPDRITREGREVVWTYFCGRSVFQFWSLDGRLGVVRHTRTP